MTLPVRFRFGTRADHARVLKEWLPAYSRSPFARFLTPRPAWGLRASPLYYAWQRAIAEHILERAELRIASWDGAPSSLAGWAIVGKTEQGVPIVHFAHVIPTCRRHGIAKQLLEEELAAPRAIYTHRTSACELLPIPSTWVYDPRFAIVAGHTEKGTA